MHILIDRNKCEVLHVSQELSAVERAGLAIPATHRVFVCSPDYTNLGLLSIAEARRLLINLRGDVLNPHESSMLFIKLATVNLLNSLPETGASGEPVIAKLFRLEHKRRPKDATICGAIWAICDEYMGDGEAPNWDALRKLVIDACRNRSYTEGTARTQFINYRRTYDETRKSLQASGSSLQA